MAVTLYCVPKYLLLLLFLADICGHDGSCFPSNNVKLAFKDLQHINLWDFGYLSRIVHQAFSSTKKLPRRQVSVWHKHSHICLLIRKKDITVDMDVEKNPGPVIGSNFGFSSFVDSRITYFNSHLESLPLSLSSYLLMRFNSYANSPQCFVYARDELFSICFGSTGWKLSQRLLSHLKVNSLLRYCGKQAGKSKPLRSDDRAIPVLNRPCQITIWCARKRTLTSLINCYSSRLPTFSHLKPTTTRFALFNVRSVRNKRLLIKDYVIDNDVDIFALTETWLHSDNRDDQVIGDLNSGWILIRSIMYPDNLVMVVVWVF